MLLRNISKYFNYSAACASIKGRQENVFCKIYYHSDSNMKDYIGPPDKVSNIRPINRASPSIMNSVQKRLHRRQIEIDNWNHEFWTSHNNRFYQEKEKFLLLYRQNTEDEISADILSEFYKKFLEKNRRLHFYYNISWYMKNFELLFLESQVKVGILLNKIKTNHTST